MRLYLLGRGIQHSMSPGMWNRAFQQLRLGWRYGLLDTDEDGLVAALEGLRDPQVLGYNVTMPYKGWAYERSEVHTRDVERARGGNWLHMQDGRFALANSDVEGARVLLAAIPPSDRVLLLGAGATAAAMLTALDGRADRVVIANRTYERAVKLKQRASWWPEGAVTVVPWHDRSREASKATLLIHTTPLGMRDNLSPLEEPDLRNDAQIYDLVYRQGPTPLQQQAARWGLRFTDGLAHLEAQAVALLPCLGLSPDQADLVRSSLAAAAGRSPHRWRVPELMTLRQ